MQEQHENNSDFEQTLKEAEELDIYIPNWVNNRFSNLYKFAYLQVKKDKDCEGMSAANRTKLIKNLMNMYYKKILQNAAQQEVEAQRESSAEGRKHCPVVI